MEYDHYEVTIMAERAKDFHTALYTMSRALGYFASTQEVVEGINKLEKLAQEANEILEEFKVSKANDNLYLDSLRDVGREASELAQRTMKILLKNAENYLRG